MRSLAWTYDGVNNIITKTGYDGFVTMFQYNAVNRLTSMSNPDHLQVSYFYDGAGRLVNRILSNDVKSFYQYDNDNRLTLLLNEGGQGLEVSHAAYTYYDAGNITRVSAGPQGAEQNTSYTYDVINRLTNVDATGTANDEAYTYDKVGNRVEKLDGAAAVLQSYVYDQKNRIQLQVARTAPQTRNYYLEAEHLEAITDATGKFTDRYFRGVVVDEIVHSYHIDRSNAETAMTFHHDHLRSVTSTVDRLGAELSTAEYGPFGGLLSETGDDNGNRLRYTGRELDEETRLYYYRARYYDPEIGRFLSEDPIGFRAGPNFYTYVNNNPIRFSDPMGLEGADFFNDGKYDMGSNPNGNTILNFVEDYTPFILEISIRHDQLLNSIGIPDVDKNPFTMLMNVVTMPIAAADGIIGNVLDTLTFEKLDFGVDSFSLPSVINSFSGASKAVPKAPNIGRASGGFVIYPNKPNTNMMQRVYSK